MRLTGRAQLMALVATALGLLLVSGRAVQTSSLGSESGPPPSTPTTTMGPAEQWLAIPPSTTGASRHSL